eukprot:jgi/Psemu1/304449/fgenesh1_kg.153_\
MIPIAVVVTQFRFKANSALLSLSLLIIRIRIRWFDYFQKRFESVTCHPALFCFLHSSVFDVPIICFV